MNPIEQQELKHWLKVNAPILRKYASDELAFMAKLAGFSADSIYQIIPEAHRDLQTHSTGKIREDWFVNRETDHIEEKAGKPKLMEQWRKLSLYEHGMDWQ